MRLVLAICTAAFAALPAHAAEPGGADASGPLSIQHTALCHKAGYLTVAAALCDLDVAPLAKAYRQQAFSSQPDLTKAAVNGAIDGSAAETLKRANKEGRRKFCAQAKAALPMLRAELDHPE